MNYAIGVDLGGTNIKMLAIDEQGAILCEKSRPTQDYNDPQRLLWRDNIAEMISEIEQEQGYSAKWIGLAAPGMASRDHSCILSFSGRLEGIAKLNWTDFLKRDTEVTVLNDAHAALYGEHWLGTAAGIDNVVFLTLGTGVGGAFLIDGKLIGGATGRAGHLGHTCLNPDMPKDICNSPGSIELMIGECTVKERTEGRFNETKHLVAAYLAGDKFATEIWLKSVHALACALSTFINILDPEIILLGGGISKAGDALFKPLAKFMDDVEWRPEGIQVSIQSAQLENTAGSIGAARFAMLHSKPVASQASAI
ncbi:MAG: ROK family protein [Verrucomicrobia bacterium CG_4_10_14_3_um_filter_43_23]|nr:MAG: ROK family protein [Verrucomicrobia bacterium CG_4_10_14_3_um_filter_43_23]PJA43979.1 MAG: ROK family protein [Verrucomicrobia bacterium CG_4_9_14_3_um_filter_43_20]